MKHLSELYFDWMCDKIKDRKHPYQDYSELLKLLNRKKYEYVIDMDANRYEDGIDLRYRFAYENRIDHSRIACEIDIGDCSILEMMVALSIRLENLMDNPKYGNRIPFWFWSMIDNLGLSGMVNEKIDEYVINDILMSFMNNVYSKTGDGGLFIVRNSAFDMSRIDIWTQAMQYLNYILEKGG